MNNKNLLPLAIALLMFPQIAQTLYSPALGDIGRVFKVSPEAAAQTLSVYFLAFAVGVVVWGRLCDRIGRRPVMLVGLAIYAVAMVIALRVSSFNGLLLAQGVAAFGARWARWSRRLCCATVSKGQNWRGFSLGASRWRQVCNRSVQRR